MHVQNVKVTLQAKKITIIIFNVDNKAFVRNIRKPLSKFRKVYDHLWCKKKKKVVVGFYLCFQISFTATERTPQMRFSR